MLGAHSKLSQPLICSWPIRSHRIAKLFIDPCGGGVRGGDGFGVLWGVNEDDMVGDKDERAPTTLKELSQRVTNLAATLARDTREMYVRFEDAQDDRALQRARVNTLFRDRRYHLHTTMLLESEARHARQGHDRTKEPEPARDQEPQDGPAAAGSSC
ncbi:hypothetical protein Tco_0492844 [Tanacetum coccineum]